MFAWSDIDRPSAVLKPDDAPADEIRSLPGH
jgi:hypothetical protein